MLLSLLRPLFLALVLGVAWLPARSALAQVPTNQIGVVLMHGKGGTPLKYISDLATALEREGFRVANLEMPWSGQRSYDTTVEQAEAEVEAALRSLRDQGARTLFVGGLSQGGLFALHFGAKHVVDGLIAIAPGGNVASLVFREKLGEYVDTARRLVEEGKGDEKARLMDFEGAKGSFPVVATPVAWLSWFDPDGAMNQTTAVRNVNPAIPVLYIVPTRDQPGLLRVKQRMFDALPRHPRTKLYEPDATHLGSAAASVQEVIDWTIAVAGDR